MINFNSVTIFKVDSRLYTLTYSTPKIDEILVHCAPLPPPANDNGGGWLTPRPGRFTPWRHVPIV